MDYSKVMKHGLPKAAIDHFCESAVLMSLAEVTKLADEAIDADGTEIPPVFMNMETAITKKSAKLTIDGKTVTQKKIVNFNSQTKNYFTYIIGAAFLEAERMGVPKNQSQFANSLLEDSIENSTDSSPVSPFLIGLWNSEMGGGQDADDFGLVKYFTESTTMKRLIADDEVRKHVSEYLRVFATMIAKSVAGHVWANLLTGTMRSPDSFTPMRFVEFLLNKNHTMDEQYRITQETITNIRAYDEICTKKKVVKKPPAIIATQTDLDDNKLINGDVPEGESLDMEILRKNAETLKLEDVNTADEVDTISDNGGEGLSDD